MVDARLELRRARGQLAQLEVRRGELLLEDLVVEILDLVPTYRPGFRLQPCAAISSIVATRQTPVTSR